MTIADIDPMDLVDPVRYARNGYPHAAWTRLRAEAPVAHFTPPGYPPFWAITRHADVSEISTRPLRFSSAKGNIFLSPSTAQPVSSSFFTMDPPKHPPMRRLASAPFTPRALRALRADVDQIAVELLDQAATGGTIREGDFVEAVAAPLPIAVIARILGVPRPDWESLYRWSNQIIGKDDPEFRRPGETPDQTRGRAHGEMNAYFERLIERRRSDPESDLLSDLVRARLDEKPLSREQLLSYCHLILVAGNETTRNAISGGLLAFSEYRDEWEKLRDRPDLLSSAVEEILRWVSPIIHFTRTAMEDCEVRGVKIRAGEQLAMFYGSANRDEEVFTDPFSFRIDRHPNDHLAFGFGPHYCLGAPLARIEIEVVLHHLLARLESFELVGPVQRLNSNVNGGIKHLPLRYRLA